MAFDPSRHRAWVVSQRPLGCLVGFRGGPLGGSFGSSWEPFGGFCWASSRPLRASWRPLGGFCWASSRPLRASWRERLDIPVRVPPLVGPSWRPLGLGAPLGRLGGPLGQSWGDRWGLLGRLEASGGRKDENAQTLQQLKEINDFCLSRPFLGVLLELSWGVSEASWAVWRQSWAS